MVHGPSRYGAVAAGHALTAGAAAEVLREGGNAFDAIIAGLWMACVCEPVLASPGGGGFMMARQDSRRRVHLFDFFTHTPKRRGDAGALQFEQVSVDFGPTTQAFHVGAGTSAAPGFVPGLFDIHDKLGSLPMTRLAGPAIAAARDGVRLSAFQAYLCAVVGPILSWTGEAAALFAPAGATLKEGDLFRNGELSDAMDAIAREGARIATHGEIAQAMLAVGGDGGALRADDLRHYAVVAREPLQHRRGAYTVHLNPPPSCGGALIADMLARLDAPATSRDMARIIDATDRKWRAARRDVAAFVAGAPTGPARAKGTTHISVIDADGNAAAASVSNGEGNGRMVPGCGFMLNNMLGEEDVNPRGAEDWPPDRRLASMMAPTLLMNDDGGVTALGSGGSNRIRTALFQVIARLLAGEGDLEAAIATPRVHVERDHLDFEDISDEDLREALTRAFEDHRAWPGANMFFGGVHAAARDAKGGFDAAGDPRRAGVAVIA